MNTDQVNYPVKFVRRLSSGRVSSLVESMLALKFILSCSIIPRASRFLNFDLAAESLPSTFSLPTRNDLEGAGRVKSECHVLGDQYGILRHEGNLRRRQKQNRFDQRIPPSGEVRRRSLRVGETFRRWISVLGK